MLKMYQNFYKNDGEGRDKIFVFRYKETVLKELKPLRNSWPRTSVLFPRGDLFPSPMILGLRNSSRNHLPSPSFVAGFANALDKSVTRF
jgi:hypothetical protein